MATPNPVSPLRGSWAQRSRRANGCDSSTGPARIVESAGLVTEPYGRDWQELLKDEDFTRMLQDPMSAIPQAVEYVSQVVSEKTATLVSLADGADFWWRA